MFGDVVVPIQVEEKSTILALVVFLGAPGLVA
jgi:hypothetical protein